MNDTTIALPAAAVGPAVKAQLRHSARVAHARALLLILPLMLFLLVTFLLPLGGMLLQSVRNPEVVAVMPQTLKALSGWNGKSIPDERASRALLTDLTAARDDGYRLAEAGKRLNMEIAGYRSLVMKTVRHLDELNAAPSARSALLQLDERWGDPAYWHAIARNGSPETPFYLLAALDHNVNDQGDIVHSEPERAIYLDVFARTFGMSLVVTVACVLLGFPVAYLLAKLPTRQSNLLMILVLLPFWTSVLVRVAAWIVLLQSGGLINSTLLDLGLIKTPLELVFNRTGVYISMVHILLPFMILPIYSVMRGISPSYMRAAVSLGCHPIPGFWRIYFPQTVAGVAAGALLVFILSIGYYITPALLGSPKEQMVSYFVAFYTNTTVNWGMATALGTLLLVATLILYAVYNRLVGASRLQLG